MIRPARSHSLWFAYVLHRVSGVILAVFLPVHFWVLSYALTQPRQLDAFLQFASNPLVKFAEIGLVFLLAAHLMGGLRLMALEWLPWSPRQKTLAAAAIGVAVLISGTFLLKAV